jgi:hypothetical protein
VLISIEFWGYLQDTVHSAFKSQHMMCSLHNDGTLHNFVSLFIATCAERATCDSQPPARRAQHSLVFICLGRFLAGKQKQVFVFLTFNF